MSLKNMELSINEARLQLSKLIQMISSCQISSVIIVKNGKPVAKLVPFSKEKSKRIGAAKKEMKDFDLSLEDFNSISTDIF